jgi:hypothetical protein
MEQQTKLHMSLLDGTFIMLQQERFLCPIALFEVELQCRYPSRMWISKAEYDEVGPHCPSEMFNLVSESIMLDPTCSLKLFRGVKTRRGAEREVIVSTSQTNN